MSARFAPRPALRQLRWTLQRRAESTTSKAAETVTSTAQKAREGVSEAASKAQQGLSRVTSSAGSAVSNAASSAASTTQQAVSASGGRIGQAVNFVQSLIPPTIYYARVAGELGKLMFQGRNMYPPTMQTIQSYLAPLQNAIRNPSALLNRASSTASATSKTAQSTAMEATNNPENVLSRLRSMDVTTLQTVGVVAAEVLGFFTVGEMIGRFKIVGYRGAHGSEHH